MPVLNSKTDNKPDHVAAVLEQTQQLLEHPALQQHSEADKHNLITTEITQELRTLQARLIAPDEQDNAQLQKWCSNRRTSKRLANISSALDALQIVNVDNLTSTQQAQPAANKWKMYDENDKHQKVLAHCAHHLRTGTNYNKDFTKYLGLTSFIKQQKISAVTLKRTQEAALVAAAGKDASIVTDKILKTARSTAIHADHAALTAEGVTAGSHALEAAGPALGSFLHSIPIVGAAITAAKALYDLGHSFMKKRGLSDKVSNALMFAFTAAATALIVAFPVAAAGIMAGVVAATTINDYVKPFLQIRKQIKQKENDLIATDKRINELDTPLNKLTSDEKAMLTRQVEKFYVENQHISINELKDAKLAIQSGDMQKLTSNKVLAEAIKATPEQNIEKFLQAKHRENLASTKNEITALKKEKNTMLARSVNGIFTVAGAVMLAIPFLPVQIAGAAILIASSIAGAVIKYREQIGRAFTRLKNGIKKIFGLSKQEELSKDTPEPEPELSHVASKQMDAPRMDTDSPREQAALTASNIAHAPESGKAPQQLEEVRPMRAEESSPQTLLEANKSAAEPKTVENEPEEPTTPRFR